MPQQPSREPWNHNWTPGDEQAFRQWYADVAQRRNLSPDPDDPQHFYDWRAAYRAGMHEDASGHWPSEFKRLGHPNLVVDGMDTRTNTPLKDSPDVLIAAISAMARAFARK